jgi:SAM-dependent methyltransferase
MDFYESISAYYDHIFPVDAQAVRFLAARARAGSRVLDLACGTGGHAVELARLGHRVTGVDLDAAMIRLAQAKAAAAMAGGKGGPHFQVLDMREAGKSLPAGYGLVYCVGNSLVHLESEQAIGEALADWRGLLEPGGNLVVQILNYDRIVARHVVELPTLVSENPPLRFVRRYDHSAGDRVVQFRTELTVREAGGERTVSNTVPLCIVSKEALERLAREAGFRHLEVFGGFGGEPLGPDSLPLILCARPER